MTIPKPIPNQRHLFSIPDDVHYLNCAYMAPLAHPVLDAVKTGADFKARPWTITPASFFTHAEAFREKAARLLGGRADDIAIVPSVSYGLATAAKQISVSAGQEVVVLDRQFPSNVYVWREKAAECGASVRTVMRGESGWTEPALDAIEADTAIVALPHCHWADGGRLDLTAIGARCREVGAALVLDLTQSLGAMRFDLAAIQPDFVACAAYKWMLGPYGIGFLYAAPKWQDGQPIEANWINRGGSDDFARLVHYRDDYHAGARRYDMGEKSNPPLLNGAAAALDLLHEWGRAEIETTLSAMTADLAEQARALGLEADDEPCRAPHFLSLRFPKGMPDDLADRMAAENVFVSLRSTSMRVTPHLWVNEADRARFLSVLKAAL